MPKPSTVWRRPAARVSGVTVTCWAHAGPAAASATSTGTHRQTPGRVAFVPVARIVPSPVALTPRGPTVSMCPAFWPPEPLVNQQIGRYRLLKRLALGGMAEIRLARQAGAQGFEKLVVIKRILPHLAENPEFVEMFLDEARLVAHLTHPNIAQIYDLGHEDGSYFIAMEHVHGENLRTVLKRRRELALGPLPAPLVARIGAACCQALAYAHAATDAGGRPLNVVHRDVSPQNLLLAYDGQVKVVDFGIAKAATQVVVTRTGVLKGKYSYMSPEHCRGDPLDGRSDLFALGVVLWELVSGRRLYSRKTDMQTFMAICNEPPPSLASIGIEVPEALEAVIRRALDKDREARFADGYEMADALERYLRQTEAPVTQRGLAAEMERLFSERIAGWRAVLQGNTAEVDEALMGGHSELFQQGTPSRSGSQASAVAAVSADDERADEPADAAAAQVPDLATGATVIRPGAVPPAAPAEVPVDLVDDADPVDGETRLRAGTSAPAADGRAGAGGGPRPRRALVFGGLAVATAGVVAAVLLALGHAGKHPATKAAVASASPAHPVATANPAPATPPAPPSHHPAPPPHHPAPVHHVPVVHPPPAHHPAPAHQVAHAHHAAPGHLTFDARPWCRVTLDGHALGTTPLARVTVSAGIHHLVCAGPGGATQRLTLHVAPGQTVRRRVSFEPGHLAFRVKPWGHVSVDGKDLGITPLPAKAIAPGRHLVVVTNAKLGARRTLKVDVAAGKTRVVTVDLH